MAMKNNELVKNITFNINQISNEMIYYKINDRDINIIKQNNIQIYKDHTNYYCIISMRQLYQLFPNSKTIKIKYYCCKCGKMNILECQNITRKLQSCDNNLWCQKCTIHIKRSQALYKYSNIPTSKQQIFFYNMFKEISILNYPEGPLHIDIALLLLKIGIEYNDGGHDLNIKLKSINKQEFIAKEWRRQYVLIKEQWKMIYIISPNDKINNYNYDEYIKIFNYCYYLFYNDNELTIEIYIENNFILTKHSITYITDILNENNINQTKKIQIFTINKTIEYLHISKKTLYSLNNKKILLMNITPMNFRYYTQNQLDEYIKHFGKISDKYFTINEAAIYLNTTKNKIELLRYMRQLYPLVINYEEYYEKQQLNNIRKNKILNQYDLITTIAHKYNIDHSKLRYWINTYNILGININDNIFYNEIEVDNCIQQWTNIINNYYSTNAALRILHITEKTLKNMTIKYNINTIIFNQKIYYLKSDIQKYIISDKEYLSIGKAAKYLKCTISYLHKLYETNQLIPAKIIDNKYQFYYTKLQLDNYLLSIKPIGYFTANEVMKCLNISKGNLQYLRKAHKIKYIKHDENNFLYSQKSIIQMLKYNSAIGNNIYYTSNQAADYLGINQNTLLKWKNNKLIPAININNNFFYSKKQLDQYLLTQQDLNNNYFYAQQAANYLNIPLSTFFKYIQEYNIQFNKIYNNKKYYLKEDIYKLQQLINNKDNIDYNKMTETAAAKYLNVVRSTIYKLKKQGKLIPCIQNNQRKYYTKQQLDEYINKMNIEKINLNNNYYTLQQVANLLQLKYDTFLDRINKNKFAFNIEIINNRKYIAQVEINEYLKNK